MRLLCWRNFRIIGHEIRTNFGEKRSDKKKTVGWRFKLASWSSLNHFHRNRRIPSCSCSTFKQLSSRCCLIFKIALVLFIVKGKLLENRALYGEFLLRKIDYCVSVYQILYLNNERIFNESNILLSSKLYVYFYLSKSFYLSIINYFNPNQKYLIPSKLFPNNKILKKILWIFSREFHEHFQQNSENSQEDFLNILERSCIYLL